MNEKYLTKKEFKQYKILIYALALLVALLLVVEGGLFVP